MDFNTFAAIVLVKEEPSIVLTVHRLKYFFDQIVLVLDVEKDPTIEPIRKLMEKIHNIKIVHSTSDIFSELRNLGDQAAGNYTWHLHVDCDEKFDRKFLIRKEMICRVKKSTSFRFPRINLPDKKNYPDYQVRLFKYENDDSILWKNARHEILWHAKKNKKLDKIDCTTLDQYPIIHDERRKEIKRDWW